MKKQHYSEARPNHPDFMTSYELRDIKFDGIRHNSLTHRREVWVQGACIIDAGSEEELAQKYEERFGLRLGT